ncbi:tetratricopeptide repeat protein, partial [Streptomyces sp. NPDC056390]|uniref:tetratricopeptide repeat protein n=1 Tax=Streptomyces sp. NPDC056390 TaxID=3345806 RepID=UPI0035DA362F
GHHQEAADLHQQNLTDRERILGPEHPDTLRSRSNLADAQDSIRARTARGQRRRFWPWGRQ